MQCTFLEENLSNIQNICEYINLRMCLNAFTSIAARKQQILMEKNPLKTCHAQKPVGFLLRSPVVLTSIPCVCV